MNFGVTQEFELDFRVLQGKIAESLQKLDFQFFEDFLYYTPSMAYVIFYCTHLWALCTLRTRTVMLYTTEGMQ